MCKEGLKNIICKQTKKKNAPLFQLALKQLQKLIMY